MFACKFFWFVCMFVCPFECMYVRACHRACVCDFSDAISVISQYLFVLVSILHSSYITYLCMSVCLYDFMCVYIYIYMNDESCICVNIM